MSDLSPEPGWFQIVIQAPEEVAELIGAWLVVQACLGVEFRDGDCLSRPQDLPPEQMEIRAPWARDTLPEDVLGEFTRFLKTVPASLCDVSGVSARIEGLDQEDWANNWRDHFSPVTIGRFYVHPGWVEAGPEDGLAVRIDPGLAFGTGLHPTTRLCLAGLDEALERAPLTSVLDVGCGSGILAIAAARAGGERIVALDNDPQACVVARENLILNKLPGRVKVLDDDLKQIQGRYQLVLANILSGVLIHMGRDLVQRLEPDGRLLLAGLLDEESQRVAGVFLECGCRLVGQVSDGGWTRLDLVLDP